MIEITNFSPRRGSTENTPLLAAGRFIHTHRDLQCLTDNRRISEIAFSLGFNSESDFSRSFQRFFQFTPSEVRYSNAIFSQDNSVSNSQNERDFHFEDWVRKL